MKSQEELLHFLNFLDLDEDLINNRLKSLMVKTNHSNEHLTNVIQCLMYKTLINTQENTECDNEDEYDFIVQLLKELNSHNIDKISQIFNIVLNLNKSNIVSKSEHLLQQILSNINCQSETSANNTETYEILLNLKVCDSILDAVIKNNEKIALYFLETPLERLLDTSDEILKTHFLTSTVPKLFEGVIGFNILDRVWKYIRKYNDANKQNALKILCCLSHYFLPTQNVINKIKYTSDIVFDCEFWEIILFGLQSNDPEARKISVYLSKKVIDCIMAMNKDVNIHSENGVIFIWKTSSSNTLKNMWDNFFILLDSLEEKQFNIVLPSLKLFESIKISECWLNCAYNMGLKHDNTLIKLKCLEYRLKYSIRNKTDAVVILHAVNDIYLYDHKVDYKILKQNISNVLVDRKSLLVVVAAIPLIKWAPVPLYHITDILSNLKTEHCLGHEIINILNIPCNNVVIRHAVYINILHFIKNFYTNLNLINLVNFVSLYSPAKVNNKVHQFFTIFQEISMKDDEEKQAFYNAMSETYTNIDYVIAYLVNHEEDTIIFLNILNIMINKLHNVVHRQYSDKKECQNEATFLIQLLSRTLSGDNNVAIILNELVGRQKETLIQYIQCLLLNDTSLNINEIHSIIDIFNVIDDDMKEVWLQLYKTCISLLQDNSVLDKTVFSTIIIKHLIKNEMMIKNYKHEMLDLKTFLDIIPNLKFGHFQNQSVGKLRNMLYETACEILYNLVVENSNKIFHYIKGTVDFLENVLECGGHGCLRQILKIANKIVRYLLDDDTNFDMTQFINRTWNEIEELKSNNQYTPCIKEFIDLITQDVILEKSKFNNVVIVYFNRIIEYGPVKNMPLHYFVTILQHKNIEEYGHLVYILCEILLYCPIARKDQRIADCVTLEILQNPIYELSKRDVDVHFHYEIQKLALLVLSKIVKAKTLQVIASFIINRINETFKNKQRYHGNSQLHNVLLSSLKHLLFILLTCRCIDIGKYLNWSMDMLVKLPHQVSVRICFEWYISLIFYIQKTVLNDQLLRILKSKNIPLTSQFIIIYWMLKRKIKNNTYANDEYEFVMDFLLANTMGQLFNVRLQAQFLATALYNIRKSPKYAYTIDIIKKTFAENVNDKNFVKLKNNYFVNEFDIVQNMSPYFIYFMLPQYCGDTYEEVDTEFVINITKSVDNNLKNDPQHQCDDFGKEWSACCPPNTEFFDINLYKDANNKEFEDVETSGTIQKKYIPWKNMSDVNVYDISKKRASSSELIVVATLIDKLPNLGGMARTSEVFGVKTYVVDSLRHLQDKQFQGLSVSAERWIDVEEVRPGRPLKDYLVKKKLEGYSVVGAEQTSTSIKLQNFRFSKKTLLLLGHEKEGIPCDLFPLMDHCVEIPQQGYVRSLNVHVTAAIFIWEYARQNVL